jgi:hypothetical protein
MEHISFLCAADVSVFAENTHIIKKSTKVLLDASKEVCIGQIYV